MLECPKNINTRFMRSRPGLRILNCDATNNVFLYDTLSYRSDHNDKVSTWLLNQIKKLAKLEQYSEFHSSTDMYIMCHVKANFLPLNRSRIYRYYESRRRKYKDTVEGREEKVKLNETKSKKRRSQKKVNHLYKVSIKFHNNISCIFKEHLL